MPYKLTYQVQLAWVGAGAGPMEALAPSAGQMLPGGGSNGQSMGLATNPAAIPVVLGAGTTGGGQPFNGSLVAADVTNLTNAMAADIAAQLNAKIAVPQGWPGGQP